MTTANNSLSQLYSVYIITFEDLNTLAAWPGQRLHEHDLVMCVGNTRVTGTGRPLYDYVLLHRGPSFLKATGFQFDLDKRLRQLFGIQLDPEQAKQLVTGERVTDLKLCGEIERLVSRMPRPYKPEPGWVLLQGLARATFRLTPKQALILVRVSQKHYDETCRRASQEGGVIHRWYRDTSNEGAFPEKDPCCEAEYRDLDLVCKILEYRVVGFSDAEYVMQEDLSSKMVRLLGRMHATYPLWRQQFSEQHEDD